MRYIERDASGLPSSTQQRKFVLFESLSRMLKSRMYSSNPKKHLFILNSELSDDSLLAMKVKLKEMNCKRKSQITFIDLAESSVNKVIGCQWRTISVIGNVGSNGRLNGRVESYKLREFLRSQKCPRLWILHHDIANSVKNLLYGKKSFSETKIHTWNPIEIVKSEANPREYFDFLAWNDEYTRTKEMQDFEHTEKGSTKVTDLEQRLNLARKTIKELKRLFPTRIPYYHTLEKREIKRTIGVPRYWNFCVVGESYSSRVFVEHVINGKKIKLAPFLKTDALIRRISFEITRVFLKLFKRHFQLRKILRKFNQNIIFRTSTFAWVDGGYFGGFVRRFLEAPSKGAVVVCPQMEVANRLGFRNRINCIYVDVTKVNQELEEISLLSQRQIRGIQRSMRELLLKNFTVDVSIGNFLHVLEVIASQKAFQCNYENGHFIIELIDDNVK